MLKYVAAFALVAMPLAALAPNQQSDDFNDGVQQYNLKLGLGWAQDNQAPYRVQALMGSFDFMATDRLSIRGNSALPLSTATGDMKFYPFMLGGALHLLPRYWLDLYVGADAGFVYISSPSANLAPSWSTQVTPLVGVTLYYWGVFYLEGEAGYNVMQYANSAPIDMSAPTFRVRMGFYL
ncbi:MAG: hypothetical protein JSR44_09030 [Spirochaetes bacterium]|nr:hypothetical protein [Spirochaetota bacterium]